jgi:hypothetical protein
LPASRRFAVERRAGRRCEYCRAPQWVCGYRFHVEHITPRALGGGDDPDSLALACGPCNFAKGARITATDAETGREVALFHPRRDRWAEHFAWLDDGIRLVGISPPGRATVGALDYNSTLRLEARRLWRALGLLS